MAIHIGGGLTDAHWALHNYYENPRLLDRVRHRFDESPPPYQSEPSGTTTQPPSPEPTEEQLIYKWENRRCQLENERGQTWPEAQFDDEIDEETRRFWKTDPLREIFELRPHGYKDKEAYKLVKDRWLEQGIWSDKWTKETRGNWRWKHELPPKSSRDSEAAATRPSLFSPPRATTSPEESTNAGIEMGDTAAQEERQRDASRPIHQFYYHISVERERIRGELENRNRMPMDINTQAYENVKQRWVARKIWDERWRVLPGMSWKHEEPLDEFLDYFAPAPTLEATTNGHQAIAGPARPDQARTPCLFGRASPERQAPVYPAIPDSAHASTEQAVATNGEAKILSHAETQTAISPPPESLQQPRSPVAKRGRPRKQGHTLAAAEGSNGTVRRAAPNGVAQALASDATPRRSPRAAERGKADDGAAAEGASGSGGRSKRRATNDASGTGKRPRRFAGNEDAVVTKAPGKGRRPKEEECCCWYKQVGDRHRAPESMKRHDTLPWLSV